MKLSFLSLIAVVLIAFTSCQKSEQLSDDQLIEAIQNSTNKQNIDPADLPSTSQSVLNSDYSESYAEDAMLAPDLGYEVGMRRGEGSHIGEHSKAYFDMNGRELLGGDKKKYKFKHKKGHDRKECFDFVLPVSFTMPDGTTITVEVKEDFLLIKAWYEENPGTQQRPEIQFPVDIEFKDGVILTVNNEEEMQSVFEDCKGQQHHEPCFDFVYPVSFMMPDGSVISGDDKAEIRLAFKDWYEANPGVDDKPELQFPVDLVFEDGSILTVNSHEEIKEAFENCDKQ